jgi:hypothetical protein
MHRKLAETINSFSNGLIACNRPEDRKLVGDYLGALAPLLARAVLGEDISKTLPDIERLFGHTLIIDVKPFEKAFEHWRDFKEEYTNAGLSGMTVNERLSALGLQSDFDQACRSNDEKKAREILQKAKVDDASINQIVKKYLK